jgi:hypothetical protein
MSLEIPAKFEPNQKFAWGQPIQICPIVIFNDNSISEFLEHTYFTKT